MRSAERSNTAPKSALTAATSRCAWSIVSAIRPGDAPELLAGEVLLDLLLHRHGQRDAGTLEEADLDGFRIGRRGADVERGVVALRLQQVLADRSRQRAQVGDVHAGRVQ